MRFLILATVVLTAGCGDEKINSYRVPKEGPAAAVAAGPAPLRWTTPSGWSERPAQGLRLASFATPSGADVSVVALPGEAGGDFANVNRWRGQLGLPELSQAAFEREVRRLRSPAGPLMLVDLRGSAGRMVAARLFAGGQSYFFKLTGAPDAVERSSTQFESLLRSLSDG